MMKSQVISKQRVADHGEVLTAHREVVAMVDLVHQEADRIESRFLEPACGDGNFLSEILDRKLSVVERRYSKSQLEYERYAVLAVSSLYGVDIQDDNVHRCRLRLLELFEARYVSLFKDRTKTACIAAVEFILNRNIIWGDALTLMTVGAKSQHIVFSEWSPINGSLLKRRDFTFQGLMAHENTRDLPLFSDLGDDVFIPAPEKEYAPVHFLELADAR
jgi:hypothetical protein